ncbi:hypothetical protein SAY87_028508 [Trapa incisa]|uniref:Late embryogenesis abundant protein LEA-2 subgroup domain-containing protein n=1 Tax=Trapa incisa TaxID=236973 RepID=A0AAN7KXY5_9MYRT|nr:hypothetical protein SAY87_028508 [Trapa incisa]
MKFSKQKQAVSLPLYQAFSSPLSEDPNHALVSPLRFFSAVSPRLCTLCAASLLLLAGITYIAWPSEPDLEVMRVRLDWIRVRTSPRFLIDISLYLEVKIINGDVYSMDYRALDVAMGYRGRALGHVRSQHGHVRALGSSYVDAELELDGVEVLNDVVLLLEDLAKGTIPLDTVTEVDGRLGVLFFGFPLKAKLSCEILVNTNNQTIVRQDCYPDELSNKQTLEDSIAGEQHRASTR